jgi:lipoyl(octanoyl) transferase
MNRKQSNPGSSNGSGRSLEAYLLGTLPFDTVLALQRRLVYQVAGDSHRAALVLAEHPPIITIGRQGSRGHLLCEPQELRARQWQVRWVNRGGGCLLHLPGQLGIYPIVALNHLGLSIQEYLEHLHEIVLSVLADFSVRGEVRPGRAGIWVGGRLVAGIGVAIRDWVTYFGIALNVCPELTPFRLVRCGAASDGPMTSIERERKGRLRMSMVRERFVEHFAARFQFPRTALFFDHPSLEKRARTNAVATSS